jgi:chromate reductase
MSEQGTITPRAAGLRVLGFAGSLRATSYNRALLRTAVDMAPDGLHIDAFDLIAFPVYNGEVEAEGDPALVAAFKTATREADAVSIACPEYNHGLPGELKNAIDWASCPPRESPLGGKLPGIIGASPGMMGHEKFDADRRLTDERTRRYLGQYLETLRQWVDQRGSRDH